MIILLAALIGCDGDEATTKTTSSTADANPTVQVETDTTKVSAPATTDESTQDDETENSQTGSTTTTSTPGTTSQNSED